MRQISAGKVWIQQDNGIGSSAGAGRPPEYREAPRRPGSAAGGFQEFQPSEFRDEVKGARKDLQHHRAPGPENRDESRHPHVRRDMGQHYPKALPSEGMIFQARFFQVTHGSCDRIEGGRICTETPASACVKSLPRQIIAELGDLAVLNKDRIHGKDSRTCYGLKYQDKVRTEEPDSSDPAIAIDSKQRERAPYQITESGRVRGSLSTGTE